MHAWHRSTYKIPLVFMWVGLTSASSNECHVNLFKRICSARCSHPTVGDRRAAANTAKVGLGWTIFSQVVSITLKRSSVHFLSTSIVSSVSQSIFNSSPMLYHFVLAFHAVFNIFLRSLVPRVPIYIQWKLYLHACYYAAVAIHHCMRINYLGFCHDLCSCLKEENWHLLLKVVAEQTQDR